MGTSAMVDEYIGVEYNGVHRAMVDEYIGDEYIGVEYNGVDRGAS